MRVLIVSLLLLLVFGVGGLAVALAMAPAVPPSLQTVETAFAGVDFSDMPAASSFAARDGAKLTYRLYRGDPAMVAILVHGSSGTSGSMHAVARAIHARGWTAYTLSMRGHDHTGRAGDIDYIGQLDDDLADFMKTIPAGPKPVLLGFSSGGGFVLRIAGGSDGRLFERFVLVSPQLPARSPVMRPNAGGWVSVALPRIIALEILSRFGIHAFDGLTTLAFAVAPQNRDAQTASYSYRMMRNFGPTDDFLGDLNRAPGPVTVLAGRDDDLFYADKYEGVLRPARPGLKLTLIPGMRHMDMTVKPVAVEAIADAVTLEPKA